jgi:flagellar hook assembly protein FlgD
LQNYPNPFTEGTSIEIKLDHPGRCHLSILDLNGRIIRTLNDDDQLSTSHILYWDGRDNFGNQVVSGIYFYRLADKVYSQMKRMVKI